MSLKEKRILILGATGTLGHKMIQAGNLMDLSIYGTARNISSQLKKITSFENQIFDKLDLETNEGQKNLKEIITQQGFDVIINCIGIIPQKSQNPAEMIALNSLFPHQLAEVCNQNSAHLIHISTDCVFSGNQGHYTEKDKPDASNLYGKSKELGEVTYGDNLTVRTSLIGRELGNSHAGLVEWFLAQTGSIDGYTNAIWSGLTTTYLSKSLFQIVEDFPYLTGLVHLASPVGIDKYSLLQLLKQSFKKDIVINKDDQIKVDKTLIMSQVFQGKIQIPTYDQMIKELSEESCY
jgi:dTDP-4-dehydrorhamnose reductase